MGALLEKETNRLEVIKPNMGKYDDIINLPHHVSKNHTPMSVYNRAAQFAPFAALVGYSESIKNSEINYVSRTLLSEDEKIKIDHMLHVINKNDEIKINYFVEVKNKNLGLYEEYIGKIKKIDLYENLLILENEKKIKIKNIKSIIVINDESH